MGALASFNIFLRRSIILPRRRKTICQPLLHHDLYSETASMKRQTPLCFEAAFARRILRIIRPVLVEHIKDGCPCTWS
jgi:hypothetical protein